MKKPVWKQQLLPNSCALCSMSMLLSTRDVHLEVSDISKLCYMAYMIEYDEAGKAFYCGFSAYQNASNYRNCTLPYQLDLEEFITDDVDAYMEMVLKLAALGHAMIVSIASKKLPYNKDAPSVSGNHAILLERIQAGNAFFIDSSGGLSRSVKMDFESVKDQVCYSLTLPEFRDALLARESRKYILSYLVHNQGRYDFLSPQMIQRNSIASMKIYPRLLADSLKECFQDGKLDYRAFHTTCYDFIKPFTDDLRTAIELLTLNQPIIPFLIGYREKTFEFMGSMKSNIKLDYQDIITYYEEQSMMLQGLVNSYLEEWKQTL